MLLLVIDNTESLPPLFSDVCDADIQGQVSDPSSKSSLQLYRLM